MGHRLVLALPLDKEGWVEDNMTYRVCTMIG